MSDLPQFESLKTWLSNYVSAQKAALDSISPLEVENAVNLLREAHTHDRQIFVIGNGGSAANASHFATDLGKGSSDALGKRFRVMSLTDNTPWITALGNDDDYADIFRRQLENFARPALNRAWNSADVLPSIVIIVPTTFQICCRQPDNLPPSA